MNDGIILTRLNDEEKTRLLEDPRAGYFEGHGRIMKKWVSLRDSLDLERYLPTSDQGMRHPENILN